MGYKIDKKTYKEFIEYALQTGFDDEESAKDQLEYLVNLFNNLPDPIKLYRLVFLSSPKDFRENVPGEHYVLNKRKLIEDHYDKMLYDYSEFQDSKPYIVTVEVPKSKINFEHTITNNLAYPHEQEITLKDKGMGAKFISLKELKR